MIKPDVQDPRNLFRTQRRFSVGNTRPRNVTVLGCRSAASAQRLIGRSRYSRGVTCDFKSLPSYAKSAPGVPNGKAGLAARAKVSYAGVNGFLRPLSDPECNRRFWALSIGQLFCSVATLVHDSYIPLYLSQELGLNNTKIGVLHAVSQLLAQVSKGVAGVVGDILGSQIKVVVFGTLVTSLCKPLFALSAGMKGAMGPAAALWLVGVGKMLDRSSKGIRDAPSKTLVQQLSRESGDSSEAAFGMRQSLSCAGSLLGSVVAAATFALCGRSYTLTFGVALIPPVLALLWLIVTFREQLMEPASASGRSGGGGGSSRKGGMIEANPVSFFYCMRALMSQLQPAYWQSLAVLATLYLARFDFSFVMLRAKQVVPAEALPMMVAACMVTQSMCASVFGQLARQSGVYGRNRILLTGFGVLVVANAVMSLPQMASPAGMALGSLLIGLHMGMSHALLISMCSTYMPHWGVPGIPSLAGTAMSFTDIVLGVVLACANLLAGRLSDLTVSAGLGSVGCFAAGAVAATLAGVLLLLFERFGALGKQELVPSWPSRGRPPTRTVRPRHA